jgi:hypothetical protein
MKNITDNIKAILSIIVVVLGISYFYMCSLRDIKPDPQILIAMVGSIGTCLGYYFGSSSSKKEDANPVAKTDSGDINVKP